MYSCLTYLGFVNRRRIAVFALPAGHHRPSYQLRRRRWFWLWRPSIATKLFSYVWT